MVKKTIIFDAERMKYHHTGLYHFCLNLGLAISNSKPVTDDIYFYNHHKNQKVFGEDANYLKQYSYQKFLKPRFRRYDIWHATYQLSSYIPTDRQSKVILTIHDLNFLKEEKSEDKIKSYLRKLQYNINLSEEIVAISNYVKSDIEKYCELGERKVHVIYNGSTIDANRISKNYQPINERSIFTIGTINRKKNFHILPYLLLGNDYHLVISGVVQEEEYKDKILRIARDIGVDKRVLLTGPISEEEKYERLSKCSLFVFPSIAEGFGLPVIEAMSFGKKVLLSTYTCLPEIGGTEAYYLESTTPSYMEDFGRNKLQSLMESPTRENEIKQWAQRFSWHNAAREYWNLYEKMLNR